MVLAAAPVALIVALLTSAAADAQPPAHPTFAKDIAPIVRSRCAGCHQPGEIGPFSLLTYHDVKRRATIVADVTARRVMPPWKPRAGAGDFADARALTDAELQLLQRWLADGMLEGDAADLPPPTRTSGWRLRPPDLLVAMDDAFVVKAGGADVFRTFVLPIPIDRARYVRAMDFRPDNARVVHHANIG